VRQVFLSLGSNLGDRLAHLQSAIDKLHAKDVLITKVSSVYETAPVDYKEQPDFLNIAVETYTSLLPMRLLLRTQRIEREMGRKRTIPKGPRPIDIDILLHGSAIVSVATLQIPHPRMHERRFVLVPLAELAPELRHPVTRQTMRDLLAAAPHQFVRRTPLRIRLPGSRAEERT
jgi:2-amino-4-hydroxy-6-hydroxymethyldihydropteridine diphosphokinase